jgi:hypothetical protein
MKNVVVAAVCTAVLSTVLAVAHVVTASEDAPSVSSAEDANAALKCATYAEDGAGDEEPIGPARKPSHCEIFIASDNAQDELDLPQRATPRAEASPHSIFPQ